MASTSRARKTPAGAPTRTPPRQFELCLKQDTNYLPALVELASLANRRADPAAALGFARHALSIDTYDPGANYQFGLASAALGHKADTKEAFSIAALSPGWRSAAGTELAKEYLREKLYDRALPAPRKVSTATSAISTPCNCAPASTGSGAIPPARDAALAALLELDPLNHFARFEQYLRGKARAAGFTGLIRNELPYETFLELAAWYHDVGLDTDAAKVLDLAPPTAEVLYWLAYLRRDTNLARPRRSSVARVRLPVPDGGNSGVRMGRAATPGLAA